MDDVCCIDIQRIIFLMYYCRESLICLLEKNFVEPIIVTVEMVKV